MVTGYHLPLCIITSHSDLISAADNLKIDRIMIDLERLDKEKRQKGKNLFISNHSESDISTAKSLLKNTRLMVRINKIHAHSPDEIDRVIENGADIIMLPYFSTVDEVKLFIDCVAGRCKTNLLFETSDAIDNIDKILALHGIDEAHVGLNDLQITLNNRHIFDILLDGTLERIISKLKTKNIRFGFGGVAPPFFSMPIPPEAIIAEQIRYQSKLAILSRKVVQFLENNNIHLLESIIVQIESVAAEYLLADQEKFLMNRKKLIMVS